LILRLPFRFMAMQAELTGCDSLILVSYRLPVRIKREEGGKYSAKWDDENCLHKNGMSLACRCLYVGCIDVEIRSQQEQEVVEKMLFAEYDSVVLFLDPALQATFYRGFCRRYLTPIMHNQMQVARSSDPFIREEWEAYTKVNQLFANKVFGYYKEGDLVWLYDYHMMLVPSFLLQKRCTARIGFFLHSPFPSSDLWRTVPVRKELLKGLLNCDLIGFLLFEYTRNFLACCKRMLGLDYQFQKDGSLGVEYEGRHVAFQVSSFGISPSKIAARLDGMGEGTVLMTVANSELGELKQVLSNGKTLIIGLDYLDKLKGVANKLLAWEAFLNLYPRYHEQHMLVQVCISTWNHIAIPDAENVQTELEGIVGRINKHFPGAVHFESRSLVSAGARLQLWSGAEVFLCTALREAINVWPLEFTLTRHLCKLPPGVLILSEFTGFARILTGRLRVNPFSQDEVAATLYQALCMHQSERAARERKAVDYIQRSTMEVFAHRFVVDLKAMSTKCAEDFVSVGFGLGAFKMVGMGSGFQKLDTGKTLNKFQRSSRRALLLDWGGTLTAAGTGVYDHRDTADTLVSEQVLTVLRKLCAEPNTHVMILSGLSKNKVLGAFDSVPNLCLAVEHGFNFRIKDGPWQELMPGVDTSWKAVAQSMMSGYAARTHGAYVMSKGSSITWNYQEADPEFGAMQAKEVQLMLETVLEALPVVVLSGKGFVEAGLRDVNKGTVATRLIDLCVDEGKPFDFIWSVGDDSSDELMFASLKSKLGNEAPQLITTTVGRKPSEASTYLDDHNEVVAFLELLCDEGYNPPSPESMMGSKKKPLGFRGNNSSHVDLASLA